MHLDLTSVKAKLARAREHAEAVANEVTTWMDSAPYEGIPQVNADYTRYSIIHNVITPPALERWGLMIGDCFHNLRSALDHLVYAVAVHVTAQNPPPREKRLAFPIARDSAGFTEKRQRIDKPNLLGDKVWAVIESVQPYHRPHKELPPLLLLLEEFDNADKHRLLQWALEDQVGGQIENVRRKSGQGLDVKHVLLNRNPKHGAEIAALIFNVPTEDVDYHFETLMQLALVHEAGPPGNDRTDIGVLMNALRDETEAIVNEVAAGIP
jgi:hypothetical protein